MNFGKVLWVAWLAAMREKAVTQMLKYKSIVLPLMSLICIATLFPPFNWGEEKLRTERERIIYRDARLPIKKYAFLFGESTSKFLVEWSGTPEYQFLERKLIVPELLLEYVLAFCLAYLAYLYISRKRGDQPNDNDESSRSLGPRGIEAKQSARSVVSRLSHSNVVTAKPADETLVSSLLKNVMIFSADKFNRHRKG